MFGIVKFKHVFNALSLTLVLSLPTYATTSEDYEKALASFNSEEYDEAYIHLKNSLQKDPQNLAAKLLMGRILLINGYLNAAEVEFVEALEMGADVNLVANPLGNTWLFLNKYENVVNFREADSLTSNNLVEWLQIHATACVRTEDLTCAEQDYTRILELVPGNINATQGLASIAIQKGLLLRAQRLIDKAEGMDTDNAITWRLKGQLAYLQGDSTAATDYLQKALTFDREDPIALRNLVDLYLEAQDYDRAKLFVNEIIEDTPNDPLAILLNSWLESRESQNVIDNEKLEELNEFMSQLSPDLIESQPMLLYISGLTNFFNANMEQATIDFTGYLQKEPDDLQAVLMLSQVYLATQQYKQALLLLDTHETELMDNPESALILGDLYIRQNKAFKAERLVQRLELRFPENGQIQLFKIKLMAARGQREEAVRILEANFEEFKSDSTFLFTYALMHLQSAQFDLALKGARLLAARFPDESEVYNLMAGIYIRMGDLTSAKAQITKALSLNPTLFAAKFNLAATESRLGNIDASDILIDELLVLSPQHTETMLLKAYNLTQQGDRDSAQSIYFDILDLNGENVSARERLVALLRAQGNDEDALYHLDRLLKNDFDNPDYLLDKAELQIALRDNNSALKTVNIVENFITDDAARLARMSSIALTLGDDSRALSAMQSAHTIAPNDTIVTLAYARLLLRLGKPKDATTIIAPLNTTERNNANYWHVKGMVLSAQGSENEAVEAFKAALDLDPYFAQPIISLYNFALTERHGSTFIDESKKIIARAPDNLLVKNLLAQYLFFVRDYAESTALYEGLIEEPNLLNPAQAYNRLAIMKLDTSLDIAHTYIKKAFELAPNSAGVLDTYGWIEAKVGNYERSLKLLRDAYTRDANNPNIRYHLGYTLAKLNRIDEAKIELQYAVTVERPFFLRPQAEALLNSL